ncbi:Gp49 family protein [uncultured Marinobacter sp.]|uniref:Gp49 family protein n=1 Tax=uncultured Marinobacter sp. TaxID=187379 RepID=UPI00259942B5|nr:Gp49 family protein [uncultured Marinobacter sp.]
MSDQTIEDQIVAKGLTAPRISLAHVQKMKERLEYLFERCPGKTTTFCHVYLDGTFYLATGVSACVSPENFDSQVGIDVARTKAEALATDKLYELEGYRLWSELNQ